MKLGYALAWSSWSLKSNLIDEILVMITWWTKNFHVMMLAISDLAFI